MENGHLFADIVEAVDTQQIESAEVENGHLFVKGVNSMAKVDLGQVVGETGPQGPKGETGATGATGATGSTGERGTGMIHITTAPSSYTTQTGGITPTYRVSLSTVKSEGSVDEVLTGDIISQSYYLFPVGYVDSSYVYLGARTSIRGQTGATPSLEKVVQLV